VTEARRDKWVSKVGSYDGPSACASPSSDLPDRKDMGVSISILGRQFHGNGCGTGDRGKKMLDIARRHPRMPVNEKIVTQFQ
jgi:hypothetical protein